MYRVRICAALLLATLGLAGFKQQTYDALDNAKTDSPISTDMSNKTGNVTNDDNSTHDAVFSTRKADKEISERNAGMLAAITDTGVISQELYADGAR